MVNKKISFVKFAQSTPPQPYRVKSGQFSSHHTFLISFSGIINIRVKLDYLIVFRLIRNLTNYSLILEQTRKEIRKYKYKYKDLILIVFKYDRLYRIQAPIIF